MSTKSGQRQTTRTRGRRLAERSHLFRAVLWVPPSCRVLRLGGTGAAIPCGRCASAIGYPAIVSTALADSCSVPVAAGGRGKSLSPSTAERPGFTLVEVLVSLVLVGIALLIGSALVAQEYRVGRRLAAQTAVLRSLEATIEGIRAGVVPLEGQRLPPPWPPPPAVSDFTIVVQVYPWNPPGLTHLVVEAQYVLSGRLERRQIETLYWGGPP